MPRDNRFNFINKLCLDIEEKEKLYGSEGLKLWEKDINLIWDSSGIIGNGGLRYFFEINLNAETAISAYKRAGMSECAELIQKAKNLLNIQNLSNERKLEKLDNKSSELHKLSVLFWEADKSIVDKLYDYIVKNRNVDSGSDLENI